MPTPPPCVTLLAAVHRARMPAVTQWKAARSRTILASDPRPPLRHTHRRKLPSAPPLLRIASLRKVNALAVHHP